MAQSHFRSGLLIVGLLIGLYGLLRLYPQGWLFEDFIRDFYANASTELISIVHELGKMTLEKPSEGDPNNPLGPAAHSTGYKFGRPLSVGTRVITTARNNLRAAPFAYTMPLRLKLPAPGSELYFP